MLHLTQENMSRNVQQELLLFSSNWVLVLQQIKPNQCQPFGDWPTRSQTINYTILPLLLQQRQFILQKCKCGGTGLYKWCVNLWVVYRIAMQVFSHNSGKQLIFILSTLSTIFSIVILSFACVNCIMMPNWELKFQFPRYLIALLRYEVPSLTKTLIISFHLYILQNLWTNVLVHESTSLWKMIKKLLELCWVLMILWICCWKMSQSMSPPQKVEELLSLIRFCSMGITLQWYVPTKQCAALNYLILSLYFVNNIAFNILTFIILFFQTVWQIIWTALCHLMETCLLLSFSQRSMLKVILLSLALAMTILQYVFPPKSCMHALSVPS